MLDMQNDSFGGGDDYPEKIFIRIDIDPWEAASFPKDQGTWAVCSPCITDDILRTGGIGRIGEQIYTIQMIPPGLDVLRVCYGFEMTPIAAE